MKVTMYAHGSKEFAYELGEKLGLTGEALEKFKYTLYEIGFELEVDEKTGESVILKVDGRELLAETAKTDHDRTQAAVDHVCAMRCSNS